MILKAVAYFCNLRSETRARSTTTGVEIQLYAERVQEIFPVVIATGFHLFPFRTEKLSPTAPMVLHTRGRVGRRHFTTSLETRKRLGALLRLDESEGLGKGRRSEKSCVDFISAQYPHVPLNAGRANWIANLRYHRTLMGDKCRVRLAYFGISPYFRSCHRLFIPYFDP